MNQAPRVTTVIVNPSREVMEQVVMRVGRAAAGLAGGRVYPITGVYSLRGLSAGTYELAMNVDTEGQAPVIRRIPFEVR